MMGCGASSERRNRVVAARYGTDGVGKVGLSGSEATTVKKAIRACRLFESVSEQVLTDLVSNKCVAICAPPRCPYLPTCSTPRLMQSCVSGR
eukprot:COSAG02_NODE_691_length_18445_cov_23.541099_8_plen_92_part_00